MINIQHKISDTAHALTLTLTNLKEACIYFAVREVIPADWLNDRDQFLYPNDGWKTDKEFQSDCLAFTLFHGQNRISSKQGVNHWIPFTEQEVNSREKFDSNFMTDFIQGKIKQENVADLFENQEEERKPLEFSAEATAVFNAGRKLWRYYHAQPDLPCPSKGGGLAFPSFETSGCSPSFGGGRGEVNASLYDIREHFQGRNDKGKMNNKSEDEKYNLLIGNLRQALKELAKKIEPKLYEYGFLVNV